MVPVMQKPASSEFELRTQACLASLLFMLTAGTAYRSAGSISLQQGPPAPG